MKKGILEQAVRNSHCNVVITSMFISLMMLYRSNVKTMESTRLEIRLVTQILISF